MEKKIRIVGLVWILLSLLLILPACFIKLGIILILISELWDSSPIKWVREWICKSLNIISCGKICLNDCELHKK